MNFIDKVEVLSKHEEKHSLIWPSVLDSAARFTELQTFEGLAAEGQQLFSCII